MTAISQQFHMTHNLSLGRLWLHHKHGFEYTWGVQFQTDNIYKSV